jgi:hypothetical protein
MKKAIFRKVAFALLMVLSTATLSLAGDSASISVSCTIPAIPGVNVPLIAEDAKEQPQSNYSAAVVENVNLPIEKSNTVIAMFQKDSEEIRKVAGENYLVTLNTIYTR